MKAFNGGTAAIPGSIDSVQYGENFPVFPAVLGWLDELADREAIYDKAAALGDTHVNLDLKGEYREGGQEYARRNVRGFDFTQDMPKLRALIREAVLAGVKRGVSNGFRVLLMLSGDTGDPTCLGIDWLQANFAWVEDWLRGSAAKGTVHDTGEDLTRWVAYCMGYDGVVPGVQPPSKIDDWIAMARAYAGDDAVIGIELSTGYPVYAGNEFNNWKTATGKMFDFILLEMPYPVFALDFSDMPQPCPPNFLQLDNATRQHWDGAYQVIGRLVNPYSRPAEQVDGDDPHPGYLLEGTDRGPLYVNVFEFDTYGVNRGLDVRVTDARRAKLAALIAAAQNVDIC